MAAIDTILGLPNTSTWGTEIPETYRRDILHSYPQGKCTLTGILGMTDSKEITAVDISWHEKRYLIPQAKTRGTNPLTSTAPADGDSNDGTAAVVGALSATSAVSYLKVDTIKDLRAGYVIQLDDEDVHLWVKAVVPGKAVAVENGYLVVMPVRAKATITLANFAAGKSIRILGTAVGEGTGTYESAPLGLKKPYAITNCTQIFKTPFEFSGSVLKVGARWDEDGMYIERAKDAVIEHMTSLERSLLFGNRSLTFRTNSAGEEVPVRTMSGILEFLKLWDAGSTGMTINGAIYAPYSFHPAAVSDADDNKRVIANADGLLTIKRFNTWAERISRYGNNITDEKLVLLGSAAALVFSDMLRKETTVYATEKTRIYGLSVTIIHTPVGNFNLVTHPMFSADPTLRNSALILDIWNLKLRPLKSRDTSLRKNVQNNGDDCRRDEYLTELSLEFFRPDTCMFIKNISEYQAS